MDTEVLAKLMDEPDTLVWRAILDSYAAPSWQTFPLPDMSHFSNRKTWLFDMALAEENRRIAYWAFRWMKSGYDPWVYHLDMFLAHLPLEIAMFASHVLGIDDTFSADFSRPARFAGTVFAAAALRRAFAGFRFGACGLRSHMTTSRQLFLTSTTITK